MNKTIKTLSIIGIFIDIWAIISVWFVNDLNILRICCFLWILGSFINNINDIIKFREV